MTNHAPCSYLGARNNETEVVYFYLYLSFSAFYAHKAGSALVEVRATTALLGGLWSKTQPPFLGHVSKLEQEEKKETSNMVHTTFHPYSLGLVSLIGH
jgi:hypothetical protein